MKKLYKSRDSGSRPAALLTASTGCFNQPASMSKIISPALFAEHFRRAWLGARGTLRYDRRDQNDLIQLPHRIGMICLQSLEEYST